MLPTEFNYAAKPTRCFPQHFFELHFASEFKIRVMDST
jgi:hypothetical protein